MYNKKYVFGLCPHFWRRVPKTPWHFLSDKSDTGVLILITHPFQPYLNLWLIMTSRKHLGMGAG